MDINTLKQLQLINTNLFYELNPIFCIFSTLFTKFIKNIDINFTVKNSEKEFITYDK